MEENNFQPYYPQQQLFPHQELKRGERYVMRKRKDFWGREITEFYVVKDVDDAPFYKIVVVVFILSLFVFFLSKCDSDKPSGSELNQDKTEQLD